MPATFLPSSRQSFGHLMATRPGANGDSARTTATAAARQTAGHPPVTAEVAGRSSIEMTHAGETQLRPATSAVTGGCPAVGARRGGGGRAGAVAVGARTGRHQSGPNDCLLDGKKVAGILTEMDCRGRSGAGRRARHRGQPERAVAELSDRAQGDSDLSAARHRHLRRSPAFTARLLRHARGRL